MKIIHSADWQLGARFSQFGAASAQLRAARVSSLRAMLRLAGERNADAVLIAGDLFEDNQVDDATVHAALDAFREAGTLPIFILPGNHDPFTGPDCIWKRSAFEKLSENVKIFSEPEAVKLADGWLLASPLKQKLSTRDPSRALDELARALPPDALKLGMTHGALAIQGKHAPNDFPIDPAAATRGKLDYLAIGHWHSWGVHDGGRMLMPGTPEPDGFDQTDSGFVACVELTAAGGAPKIEKLPVATLHWLALEFDFLDPSASKRKISERIAPFRENFSALVLRVTLTGSAPPRELDEARAWLSIELSTALALQVEDRSSAALSPAEMQALQQEHPLLADVLGDLAQLEHFFAGAPKPENGGNDLETIDIDAAKKLTADAKIDPFKLTPAHFRLARELLTASLQEARR